MLPLARRRFVLTALAGTTLPSLAARATPRQVADLINAITQKLWPLGDDVTFIPGHGATSQFGYERKTNMFVADDILAAR